MRYIFAVIAILSMSASLLYAQSVSIHPVVPFNPIYAADQKDISFSSLFQELAQFQVLSNWEGLLGALETKKIESIKLRMDAERMEKLNQKGFVKGADYDTAVYQYQVSLLQIKELEAQSDVSKHSAETTRLGVMQEGDKSLDLRRDVAQLMKQLVEGQLLVLQIQMERERLSVAYHEKRLKNHRKLFQKNDEAEAEFKTSQLNYLTARFRILTLKRQIEVSQKSITGMDRTIKRLFNTP